MILLQPLVLKNIYLLIFEEFIFSKNVNIHLFLATISVASPLLTLEPQNLFNTGMASLWSYYNLSFLRIFYLGTISIALPLLTLEPQNVFHIGMGSLGITATCSFERYIPLFIFKEFLGWRHRPF